MKILICTRYSYLLFLPKLAKKVDENEESAKNIDATNGVFEKLRNRYNNVSNNYLKYIINVSYNDFLEKLQSIIKTEAILKGM